MVLFGTGDSLFLSHIPMFEAPHNRQVLIEASALSLAGKSFSDGSFTFRPDAFSLDALIHGQLDTTRGTIFEGNFESGGRPVASNVELKIREVPVADALLATTPMPEALEYFVMGRGNEAFLVHRIAGAQDFDQVVKFSLDREFQGQKLVFPDRAASVTDRLRPGERGQREEVHPGLPYMRFSDDIRFAVRVLGRALARVDAPSAALRVARDATWFEPPHGARADLRRRVPLQRIFELLVRRRLESAGSAVTILELQQAGWPGATLRAGSGANRVHVALATLRNLGLRAVLRRSDAGYLLDPEVPVDAASAPAETRVPGGPA